MSNRFTSPGRSKADRLQDEARRATDTVSVAGLEPDQSILELEPGKGWFTGILLELTATSGALTVQQPATLEGFFGKDARRRVERSGHPNARYSDASWNALAADVSSVDRVLWVQGPHEMWFEPGRGVSFGDPGTVFAEVERVLKPDGQFLVIDNLAPDGISQSDAGALHRSVPKELSRLVERTGLTMVTEDLDWIASDVDILTRPTYDPNNHLKTHQFMQIYKKA